MRVSITSMQFSHPCVHAPVRAKHLGAPHAPPLSPAGGSPPAGDAPTAAGADDAQEEAVPPQDSGHGHRSPTRHVLQWFFSYFCYC